MNIAIGRIKLLQSNSRELNFVVNSRPGCFINNLTHEVYGERLNFVPYYFEYVFYVLQKPANSHFNYSRLLLVTTQEQQADKEIERLGKISSTEKFFKAKAERHHLLLLRDKQEVVEITFSDKKILISQTLNSFIAGTELCRNEFLLFSEKIRLPEFEKFKWHFKLLGETSDEIFQVAKRKQENLKRMRKDEQENFTYGAGDLWSPRDRQNNVSHESL